MKKKKILQYDLDGNFLEIFESVRSACESSSIKSHTNILSCCNGKSNSVAGYQWKYHTENFPIKIDPAIKRGEIFKQKYGKNSESHTEFISRIKETNTKKFGKDHPMKNETILNEYKNTCLKIYGTDNPAKNTFIKDKISKTERERKTKIYFLDRLDVDKFKFISINNEDLIELHGKNCSHTFSINRQLFTLRTRTNHEVCTVCNDPKKNQVSEVENFIYMKLKETGIRIERNVVGLLESKEELDLFFPDFSFGVEINGIKYHSEEFGKGKYHHIKKTKSFNKVGIDVYHFFDDEVSDKSEIVFSMIMSKLGLNKRIFARKCRIESISNLVAIKFLSENHIQSSVNSEFSYGLFHGDELVSVMTFGGLRKVLGSSKKEDTFELLRFCNKLGTNVVGAASRLLKYFVQEVSPQNIVSYANLRWSTGNLYRKIGFTEEKEVSPGYYIFYKNKRHNRYKFRKSELIKMGFNESLTSDEIFDEIGAFKIWDCGNLRFEISLPRSL